MIGFYNYTVILTYIGAISGFIGMYYILNNNLIASLLCLLFSGFCDMFDGKIASTMIRTKQEQRFGIQIDSLSDMICFGALPALIGIHYSNQNVIPLIISALYLLCALIRLAWFNVDEEERQNLTTDTRKEYLGLPVTSSALFTPFIIGLDELCNIPVSTNFSYFLLLMAIAYITPFHIQKPRRIGKIIILLLGSLLFTIVMMRRFS